MTDVDVLGVEDAPAAWPWVATAVLDGEAVLYDEQRHTVHRLNPTATALWNRFDGAQTIGAVAADLAAVYRIDVGTIWDDVLRATREMARQQLLADATS